MAQAHDTGKLVRHIEALGRRHAEYEARISELHVRGPLMLSGEQVELKRIKVRKSWLKLRLVAAKRLLLMAPVAEVCHDKAATAVINELQVAA